MGEDDQLMRQAAQGDKQAFETLVLKYREHAVRFAVRFTADRYDAEDIVQECFAKLYVRRNHWREGASLKTYLYAMIRNQCTDLSRTRREWSELCEEELLLYSREGLPEASVLAKEDFSRLKSAFMALPPDYRTVLYLFAFEQMPYGEIAKIMGKSAAQIKITMYRARKALKKKLLGGEER